MKMQRFWERYFMALGPFSMSLCARHIRVMKNCVPASKAKIRNMSAILYLSAIWKKHLEAGVVQRSCLHAFWKPQDTCSCRLWRLTYCGIRWLHETYQSPDYAWGLILDPDVPYTEYLKKKINKALPRWLFEVENFARSTRRWYRQGKPERCRRSVRLPNNYLV